MIDLVVLGQISVWTLSSWAGYWHGCCTLRETTIRERGKTNHNASVTSLVQALSKSMRTASNVWKVDIVMCISMSVKIIKCTLIFSDSVRDLEGILHF